MCVLPVGLQMYVPGVAIVSNLNAVLNYKRRCCGSRRNGGGYKNIRTIVGGKLHVFYNRPGCAIAVNFKRRGAATCQSYGGNMDAFIGSIKNFKRLRNRTGR